MVLFNQVVHILWRAQFREFGKQTFSADLDSVLIWFAVVAAYLCPTLMRMDASFLLAPRRASV